METNISIDEKSKAVKSPLLPSPPSVVQRVMPVYQIPAPKPFSFKTGEEWTKWITRFERFRNASGLMEKPDAEQVNSLLYLMGSQAEDILVSFNLTKAESENYATVIEKFGTHFIPSRNIVYDRYKFYMRNQEEGESVEDFVTSLHALAQNCKFPTGFHDEMIRDRIVCGIRDKRVSERLQLETELTLEKAVTTARQAETVKKQQETFKCNTNSHTVANRIVAKKAPRTNHAEVKPKLNPDSSQTSDNKHKQCFWCGSQHIHKKTKCPAQKAICNKCKRIGHFSRVCKSKDKFKVNEVEESESGKFLGEISDADVMAVKDSVPKLNRWLAKVAFNGAELNFKIDTGADATVVPFKIYKSVLGETKIKPTFKKIFGPGGKKLNIIGALQGRMQYKGICIDETVYVMKDLGQALLSCKASEKLNLIARINEITTGFDPKEKFPKLFTGIGKIEKPYNVKLRSDAVPYAISVPRRVPLPLKDVLQKKLDEMVKKEIIEPVDEATEWCAPMVLVPKKKGDVRICVDLSELNKNIDREYFPMASVDYTLSEFQNAKVFSVIDANSGFWQIALSPESSNLTTFITPFGRFRFRRLPFGIKTAPEVFQKRMRETLKGIKGVVGLMDEFVIFGENEEEHDKRLHEVLSKLQEAGWTLNGEKCNFRKKSITFLGHIISAEGIKPDPKKIEAIKSMAEPQNVTELKRFLGMANFLNKFIPNMADKAKPLYELLQSDVTWIWGQAQEESFDLIKESLCSTPGLAMYDCNKATYIATDASSYGLGAVLYQMQDDHSRRPVAYASRTLSNAEKAYAQIEKEALGIVWGCDRFHDFIVGLTINIETDHKPLIPIFMSKPLDNLSPRLQRLKLRLLRYSYIMNFVPGKDLFLADALSRSPIQEKGDEELEEDLAAYVQMVIISIPATDKRLAELWAAQQNDYICKKLSQYCSEGWPEKQNLPTELSRYWEHKHAIISQDGLLMKGSRLIVPENMRTEILQRLHEGHQGITKCRARSQETVWWPNLSAEIQKMISSCELCIQRQTYHRETLIKSETPERPWQKLGVDLLKLKNSWYVIVGDYYSRYFEVAKLDDQRSCTVINHMKSIQYEVIRSDNGSQFSTTVHHTIEYKQFSETYGFSIVTSSPRYPQSNGFIESMVKNFKNHYLKSENKDPYLMLLALRATPLDNGYSPAELLVGRKLRTTVPTLSRHLVPQLPDITRFKQKEMARSTKQQQYYNQHHGAKDLRMLCPGETVWVKDMRTYGKIKDLHQAPRSYIVETPRGVLRRNRIFLHPSTIPEGVNL